MKTIYFRIVLRSADIKHHKYYLSLSITSKSIVRIVPYQVLYENHMRNYRPSSEIVMHLIFLLLCKKGKKKNTSLKKVPYMYLKPTAIPQQSNIPYTSIIYGAETSSCTLMGSLYTFWNIRNEINGHWTAQCAISPTPLLSVRPPGPCYVVFLSHRIKQKQMLGLVSLNVCRALKNETWVFSPRPISPLCKSNSTVFAYQRLQFMTLFDSKTPSAIETPQKSKSKKIKNK